MTQKKRIIEYMKKHGSITSMEAFENLGITKLTTRISELRSDGVIIPDEYIETKNRFGEWVSCKRYTLKEDQ